MRDEGTEGRRDGRMKGQRDGGVFDFMDFVDFMDFMEDKTNRLITF